MNVTLGEDFTWYGGKREPTAIVTVDGTEFVMSMADTRLSCLSVDHCRNVLANYAEQADANRAGLDKEALDLMTHCRKLTRWKPATEIKRDSPRRKARRFASL